jgi:hypothetical protein
MPAESGGEQPFPRDSLDPAIPGMVVEADGGQG